LMANFSPKFMEVLEVLNGLPFPKVFTIFSKREFEFYYINLYNIRNSAIFPINILI
jgi:hypothetical protein